MATSLPSRSNTTGTVPLRGRVNPATYLLALLWLALCQAFFTAPDAPLAEQEGSHVAGSPGAAKALAPAPDPLASLRRASGPQDDPPDQTLDPAIFHLVTLPVLTLAAWGFFFLRRSAPLPAIRRPGSPRAPPASSPR